MCGDPHPVAGHADEAHEALVAGPRQRLDGATRTVGDLPLVLLDEVVQLDQVDVVDVHALQRAFELGPRRVTATLAGLGGEEDVARWVGEPRPQAVLRGAVAGGGVDVVDAELGDLPSVASARLWLMPPRAAAPKMTRVDWCPVRPNGLRARVMLTWTGPYRGNCP